MCSLWFLVLVSCSSARLLYLNMSFEVFDLIHFIYFTEDLPISAGEVAVVLGTDEFI